MFCASDWCLLLAGITLITMYVLYNNRESFTTKRDKAETIYNWFKTQSSPSYADYRSAMNGKSNIVEYEDVLALFQERNLTLDSVEKAIQ
jgi:hypothetical protein